MLAKEPWLESTHTSPDPQVGIGGVKKEIPMHTLRSKILSVCRPLRFAAPALMILIPLSLGVSAQELEHPATARAAVVPQQVRYTGKLAVRAGQTVQAEFRIYAAQEGGEPLWTETQQFPIAADGSYSVLLGNASQSGLPQSVFAGGAARWLGVSVERGQEQERVLLSSVPYAMKSADAESLSGHAASDFVTQEQLATLAAKDALPASASAPTDEAAPTVFHGLTSGPLTGSGTANTIPLWTGTYTQGNSVMTQNSGTINVQGPLAMPPVSQATTANGQQSEPIQMNASAWNTVDAGPDNQTYSWVVGANGNNTATPSGTLYLQYQSGTGPKTNILRFLNTGQIAFAPTQTFPGTLASVTGVGSINTSTSAGAVTVALNVPTLELQLNGTYPRLSVANSFTGNQSITGGLTITGALSTGSSLVSGLSSSTGGFLSNGALTVKPAGVATASAPVNSPLLELGASAYSSTTSAPVAQNFAWQTYSLGNNTASPSANVALLFGSGTSAPAATGLSISSNGNINFAPGQTFPGGGAGTITGISTTSPLTGSGTTGSVALGFNTSALETTLNSTYPQLSTGNVFSSFLEAYQTGGPATAALLGWGYSGSVGVFGSSDSGYGVEAASTTGYGVYSQILTPSEGSAGVLGFTGLGFSGMYSSEAEVAEAGIWADNSNAGTAIPVALFATGDNSYGAAIVTNGADYSALFVNNNTGTAGQFEAATGYGINSSTNSGTGVFGSTEGSGSGVEGFNTTTTPQNAGVVGIANKQSTEGNSYDLYSAVWGDTGTSSTSIAPTWAVGVLGTTDDGHAAVFLNNSTAWSTMVVVNDSTGGTGLFKTFIASSPDGTCGIGSGGSLSCTGPIKGLVSASGGARQVETYAPQSAESWMEDYGTGTMQQGVALVSIDPAFAETISETPDYHVFITPNGDSAGLYVIKKTATSFEVRESKGGTSSLTFDFKIVAKRRGYEAQRLVDVTERFNTEQKSAMLMKSSGVRHKPAPLAKSPLVAGLNAHPRRLVPGRMPTPTKPLSERNKPASQHK
jgi:hypothetical protein